MTTTTFTAPKTQGEARDMLTAALPNLNERDQEFAKSMLNHYARKGGFSEGQKTYVLRLIEAGHPQAREAAEANKVDLSRLTKLFDGAAAHLKRPQVAFSCSAGEFIVSRAAENSRNPGYLYIKTVDKTYLGKVSPEGKLTMDRYAAEDSQVIFEALAGFAADPAGAAAAYGKETGICCFCSRGLTDERSVSVGYGPICAKRWDLPWGE